MPKVRLWVDVSPELMHRYEEEAERQHEPVEHLLEHTMKVLLEEMEEEERQPPDPSSVMS